jgi:hypothetical protein
MPLTDLSVGQATLIVRIQAFAMRPERPKASKLYILTFEFIVEL